MPAARIADPEAPPQGSSVDGALLERFVAAFANQDLDDLVALMTDDIWLRMPPLPFEYRGTAAVRSFLTATAVNRAGIARLVPVRANRQPAWGEYRRDPVTGNLHIVAVLVIALANDQISGMIRFDTPTAPHLGLPRTPALSAPAHQTTKTQRRRVIHRSHPALMTAKDQ